MRHGSLLLMLLLVLLSVAAPRRARHFGAAGVDCVGPLGLTGKRAGPPPEGRARPETGCCGS
jgi:hypothetical protein